MSEWDRESNVITAEDRQREEARVLEARHRYLESLQRERERRAERTVYFVPPGVNDDALSEYFPRSNNTYRDSNGYRAPWTANRVYSVCHNCGTIGFKYSRCNELSKCYICGSRNMDILRAGEISMVLRGIISPENVGTHMEEVYNERHRRLRRQREERAAQRRNAERED